MPIDGKEVVFQGIPASPGIAIGAALVAGNMFDSASAGDESISANEVEAEITKFEDALRLTREQLKELQARVLEQLDESDARIFDAHLLIVDDKMLINEVRDEIAKNLKPAEVVFNRIINRYISAISAMSDSYIRERAVDIRDVAKRIIANFSGGKSTPLDHLPGERVIIAHDLSPSDTVLLDRENVLAFGCESGSRTSHTAILSRSMKIPAVVGINELLSVVESGMIVVIDGYTGTVVVNPSVGSMELYAQKQIREDKYYTELMAETKLRPETIDGYQVQLTANLESVDEVEDIKRYGASGVGLFRTEYLFMNRNDLPDEEEQFEIFRQLAANVNGPTVIRTLDVGGDKLPGFMTAGVDTNPFLGFRGIRFCLRNDNLFRAQIRAILRAGAFGDVKIMFPMICSLEELRLAKNMVFDEMDNLRAAGQSFKQDIEIGMMMEIPAAAILAKHFAKEVDFFSIGTNDLVQYSLAVDRGNEKVAYLYWPCHPAVLKLVDETVKAACANRIWVGVCGEMAADPRYIPLLVGLGVHELSMSAFFVGTARRLIRRLRKYDAEQMVAEAMRSATGGEALKLSEQLLEQTAPDIMRMTIKGI